MSGEWGTWFGLGELSDGRTVRGARRPRWGGRIMSGTNGDRGRVVDQRSGGHFVTAPRRESAAQVLIRRKLQEVRREIARLATAIQQAEHTIGLGAETASEFSWTQTEHQLRGWLLSSMESQAYIDSVGNAHGHLEARVRQVMTVAQRRGQAERLLASRS